MGIASVVCGLLGFLCALLSVGFVAVPVAGVALSIFALLLSLVSIVLGGVGMSQASDRGESNALPLTGVIIGVIAFFFSFVLTMTCGACNACLTMVDATTDGGVSFAPAYPPPLEGGMPVKPPYIEDDAGKPPQAPDPLAVGDAATPAPVPIAPPRSDAGLTPPPPAFPPPPMNRITPGPRR